MNKKQVSVLITDLDNTLYDWFNVWHSSFRAMLDVLVSESGISEEILLPEIKRVHEKHGTSEYLMLLNELPVLQNKHPDANITEIYKNAVEIYRQKRSETLELYPSVLNTFIEIKKKGCLIVGYTDSQTLYTAYRVKELGLDGIFDFLYSSPNHDLEENEDLEANHFFPSKNHILKYTIHRQTPKNASKPNPEVLISIIEDIGVSAHQVAYVGDSFLNDISMAQAVPVTDIHAKYGVLSREDDYNLLRAVTHWKSEKVKDEEALLKKEEEPEKSDKKVIPSFELTESFAQLLDLFDFVQYKDADSQTKLRESKEKEEETARAGKEKEAELVVEIWKKTIDVQQHFNDLELRIRNFAFTVLGVILSASAVAFKEYETAYLSWILVIVGLFLWLMFYMMDYYWYHRLLIGSVRHGAKIEEDWGKHIPALGLTKAISESSPIITKRKTRIGSNERMKGFYLGIAALLGLLAIGLFIAWRMREPAAVKPAVPAVTVINNSQSPINTNVVDVGNTNSPATNVNSKSTANSSSNTN